MWSWHWLCAGLGGLKEVPSPQTFSCFGKGSTSQLDSKFQCLLRGEALHPSKVQGVEAWTGQRAGGASHGQRVRILEELCPQARVLSSCFPLLGLSGELLAGGSPVRIFLCCSFPGLGFRAFPGQRGPPTLLQAGS